MRVEIKHRDQWDNEKTDVFDLDDWLDIYLERGFYNGHRNTYPYHIENKIEQLQKAVKSLFGILTPAQKATFVEDLGENGEKIIERPIENG